MTRAVLYMAHPVSPSPEEVAETPYETVIRLHGEYEEDIRRPLSEDDRITIAVKANLDRAIGWLSFLRRSFPETTFIAPWIAGVMSVGSDGTPEEREAGVLDCCAVVERCDGIVLVGGRISTGMRREMEHGQMRHRIWIDPVDNRPAFEVYNLTSPLSLVTEDVHKTRPLGIPWKSWASTYLLRLA